MYADSTVSNILITSPHSIPEQICGEMQAMQLFFINIQLHNICLECQQRVLNQYVSFLDRLVFFYSMFVYIIQGLNLYIFKLE